MSRESSLNPTSPSSLSYVTETTSMLGLSASGTSSLSTIATSNTASDPVLPEVYLEDQTNNTHSIVASLGSSSSFRSSWDPPCTDNAAKFRKPTTGIYISSSCLCSCGSTPCMRSPTTLHTTMQPRQPTLCTDTSHTTTHGTIVHAPTDAQHVHQQQQQPQQQSGLWQRSQQLQQRT